MEERLDDAINVLRNHAESQIGLSLLGAEYASELAAPPPLHPAPHPSGMHTKNNVQYIRGNNLFFQFFKVVFIPE